MSLYGRKSVQISLHKPKQTQMSWKEPKWAQILINFLPVTHVSVRQVKIFKAT